ncbi:4Fe-4S cluster-binding domain-containing protein [Candidatus Methylospira mobilis]|nr:4Fe-4S cluster-binding domain-containing protein [Candidatus Methylospira mobilis]WNV06751.1 4Fe-4S cluster-binding domain-containing protein [Candidatus Methylospira mobilis]
MTLPELKLPDTLNYVGAFLTLQCNLSCSYCINDPEQKGQRESLFPIKAKTQRICLTPDEWTRALNRIPYRQDLPITLQGGEPMLYWGSKGVGQILSGTQHYFDLLTNFPVKPEAFANNLNGQQHKLQRDAPYPSIRVSYHAEEMNRVWHGHGFAELVARCEALSRYGFRVSPVKADSDVGIYMVAHPQNRLTAEMEAIYAGRVPFETKEFLGLHDGKLYGHYLYPFSTDLIAGGIHPRTLSCECRTTELLIDPLGFVWGCHFYLYQSWVSGGPLREFEALEAQDFRYKESGAGIFSSRILAPVGHLLDPDFAMSDLEVYRACHQYGRCIGCDTKIKNDRFQSYYDQGISHTSVEIRNIRMPESLYDKIDNLELASRFFAPTDR